MEDGLPDKSEYRRFKVKGVDGNDDYAAMEEVLTRRLTAYLDERDRPVDRARGRPVRLPAAAAAGRRRQGPAGRGRAGRAGARPRRGDPRGVAGQAVRGGVRARAGRPGRHPPPVRGAVPAAADPRRGPPLRQHVPPRAAGQAHDQERARRRARARPDPRASAGQGAGRGHGGEAGRPRRAEGADVAARRGRRGGLREGPRSAHPARRPTAPLPAPAPARTDASKCNATPIAYEWRSTRMER